MTDNETDLDAFLNQSSIAEPQKQPEEKQEEDVFAQLLDDFLTETKQETKEQTKSNGEKEITGLDDFVNNSAEENKPTVTVQGLDDFMTVEAPKVQKETLEGFVTEDDSGKSQNTSIGSGAENDGLDGAVNPDSENQESLDSFSSASSGELDGFVSPDENIEEGQETGLKAEEKELARAIANFKDGITVMASRKKLKAPQTDYTEEQLIPNYKPSVGKKIAQYLLEGWDIVNKYAPEDMKRLSPEANDEDYLTFAESLSDNYLQLAIISYVEILINIEICEVSYEQKKEQLMKNKIKKELYEEYMELQERKNIFIQKLKEKNFPIDVDKLMNNYFRAAQKDADGAFEALTKNPAMFSPIEVEKIRPKFFGLIKVTPEDGIKANQKIGKFIKNIKV